MYNEFTESLTDKIPAKDDLNAMKTFAFKLSDRLVSLYKNINETKSLDTYNSVLLLTNNDDNKKNSHISLHMPAENVNTDKSIVQQSMETMKQYDKKANTYFTDTCKGCKLTITALIDQIDNIISWLQNEHKDDCDIILSETAINTIMDYSYVDLKPACNIEDVLLAPRFLIHEYDPVNNTLNEFDEPIGYGVYTDYSDEIQEFSSYEMVIRLRKNESDNHKPLGFNGMGFYIYSAYPRYPT